MNDPKKNLAATIQNIAWLFELKAAVKNLFTSAVYIEDMCELLALGCDLFSNMRSSRTAIDTIFHTNLVCRHNAAASLSHSFAMVGCE